MKVAISYVSIEQARLNLVTELPHWDFNKTREEAKTKWNTFAKSLFEVKPELCSLIVDNIDQIEGVLFVKDLLPHIDKTEFDWKTLMQLQQGTSSGYTGITTDSSGNLYATLEKAAYDIVFWDLSSMKNNIIQYLFA